MRLSLCLSFFLSLGRSVDNTNKATLYTKLMIFREKVKTTTADTEIKTHQIEIILKIRVFFSSLDLKCCCCCCCRSREWICCTIAPYFISFYSFLFTSFISIQKFVHSVSICNFRWWPHERYFLHKFRVRIALLKCFMFICVKYSDEKKRKKILKRYIVSWMKKHEQTQTEW